MAATTIPSEASPARYLAVLAALGELTPEQQAEWQRCCAGDPDLARQAADWQQIAYALTPPAEVTAQWDVVRQGLCAGGDLAASPKSEIAPTVAHMSLLQASRAMGGGSGEAPRTAPTGRWWGRASLALAASVTFALILLHEIAPTLPESFKAGAPLRFPVGTVVWLAPGPQTRLLQPAIVWKGNPGERYHLRLEDETGRVLAWAESVQSPWLLEQPLSRGQTYTVHLAPDHSETIDSAQIKDPGSATHLRFQILPEAVPLSADLLKQMQGVMQAGHRTDALSLLYWIPEEVLSPEEFRSWQERLRDP